MELILTNGSEHLLCLNMIVKNESHIIKNTLTKLLKKVNFDYWVISDTGSTDNTKELITEFFKELDIPGELYNDEWKEWPMAYFYPLTQSVEIEGVTKTLKNIDIITGSAYPYSYDKVKETYKGIFGEENIIDEI
jgi:glycosyltransferase involved in cell wall biosynthesis